MRWRKEHPMLSMVNQLVVDLPTPSNISYFWNFGSLLGLCLGFQMITGMFLAMHYSSDIQSAFASMAHIMSDVNYGFLLSYCHANGASLFFMCVYLHIGRGIYYGSYQKLPIWVTGMIIYALMMLTAFMGYVLPWGQMSFWGATVMTNLVSAVPYMGDFLVQWMWGGFSVSGATLSSFFSLHYLMPFVLAGLAAAHMMLLHDTGSNNPLGLSSDVDKVLFHPYFSFKDILGFSVALIGLFLMVFFTPNLLGDVENFSEANPLVTPVHIQPEWYFLFAYAILRSIPNKLGGVIAMVAAILVLLLLPLSHKSSISGLTFSPLGKMLFWTLVVLFGLLTWMGSLPAEEPYITTGQMVTMGYFSYFLILFGASAWWEDKLLFDPPSSH